MTTLSGQVGRASGRETRRSSSAPGADTGRLVADLFAASSGSWPRGAGRSWSSERILKALQQVFEAPKARGAFGEESLALLLGQSFPQEHVRLQHEFKDGERVDALLMLPGGHVAIDAKFPPRPVPRPRCRPPATKRAFRALRSFGRDVRRHVDDIATKYIRPAEGTLDFRPDVRPGRERLLRGDRARRGGGRRRSERPTALKRRVVPVSPNSLYAYLQAIAYGLMGLKLEGARPAPWCRG